VLAWSAEALDVLPAFSTCRMTMAPNREASFGPWRSDLSPELRAFTLGQWSAAATAALGGRHPLTRALLEAAAGDAEALGRARCVLDKLAALPRRRLIGLVAAVPIISRRAVS
jgi:hypothetical protein